MKSFTFVSGMAVLAVAAAFQPTLMLPASVTTSTRSLTALDMANSADNDKFMRYDKAKRSASASDTVIELVRPLGLVLNQDAGGNVFVEKVAAKGNAARTGLVSEGDLVTMVSSTFGDDMWSTRGVGLTRVLAAIRVRSGPVKLVFESPGSSKKKQVATAQKLRAKEEAAEAAQRKKDALLGELEKDEQKLKRKGFFGLF